jgi:uncharacterized membrane protein YfhO
VPAQQSEAVEILPGEDPNRVVLQATLSLPGWVVLADTFYPGWTATVDGIPTPIHPTDLLFRGVFVTPGRHRIVFRYQPRSVSRGLALSITALAVCALMLRRRDAPATTAFAGEPLPESASKQRD